MRIYTSALAVVLAGTLFPQTSNAQTQENIFERQKQSAQDELAQQEDDMRAAMRPGESDEKKITLQTRQSSQYGAYLTDEQGRAVYIFEADSKGKSTCYDDCAEAWPPVLSKNPEVGQQLKKDMLGTIKRRTGEQQVAYNDLPLYYYAKDKGAGQASGQGVEGFGAEWYLLSPQGEKIKASGGEGSSKAGRDSQRKQ
ncbi:MAG: hypothetical protein J5J00_00745 [Deltaproteobacteria bacterium]|nr:hypothetical protein [Deltaproteobacteria bacterium]